MASGSRGRRGRPRPAPDSPAARPDRTGRRRRHRAAAGGQAVPGVLRLAAGEPGRDRTGHGRVAGGGRGHPSLEHEPAPDMAGRDRGRLAVPAGRVLRADRPARRGQLRLAATADLHRGRGQPGRHVRSAGRAAAGTRRAAGRRRSGSVALGRGTADRHDLGGPRHRRRTGPPGAGRERHRPRSVGGRRGRWPPPRATNCCWWPGSAPSTRPATAPRSSASPCSSPPRPASSGWIWPPRRSRCCRRRWRAGSGLGWPESTVGECVSMVAG